MAHKKLISRITGMYSHEKITHEPSSGKYFHVRGGIGVKDRAAEITRDDVLRKLTMAVPEDIHKKNVGKYIPEYEHEASHWGDGKGNKNGDVK